MDAELNLREEKASEDARVSHLTQELEASNRRIESLKLAIKTLDDHSETLMVGQDRSNATVANLESNKKQG